MSDIEIVHPWAEAPWVAASDEEQAKRDAEDAEWDRLAGAIARVAIAVDDKGRISGLLDVLSAGADGDRTVQEVGNLDLPRDGGLGVLDGVEGFADDHLGFLSSFPMA